MEKIWKCRIAVLVLCVGLGEPHKVDLGERGAERGAERGTETSPKAYVLPTRSVVGGIARWNFHAGGVACALITSFGVLISSFSTDAISQLNARNPQKTKG